MDRLRSTPIRQHWPIIISIGLLLLALAYFFLVALPNDSCSGYDRGVYWLWIIHPWIPLLTAIAAIVLVLPIQSSRKSAPIIAMLLTAAICSCGGSVRAWYFSPQHLDTIRYQNRVFHLAGCNYDLESWGTAVYSCDENGFSCRRILCDFYIGGRIASYSPPSFTLASGPGPDKITILNEDEIETTCQFRFTGP
jgi:hypothetical protein